jgi:uncharacterized integral membrane protein
MYERNESRDEELPSKGSGPSIALIASVVIAILAVVFVVQNGKRTTVEFLFFEKHVSVWVAIAVAILIGIALNSLFGFWWRRRRRTD